MKKIPLYIHIPFCRSKCSYCAFYSCINHTSVLEDEFINQLLLQIKDYMYLTGSDSLKTVYIGGGTPSVISQKNMIRLFELLKTYIKDEVEEFTMECNPEDISFDLIRLLNNSPVNRISLGVQSFNNNVLKKSGRISDEKVIARAIEIINKFWVGRFSIDVITGLPGQTISGQKEDIIKTVNSGVDHISCYSLIIEENTPLFENQDIIPDPDDEDHMWTLCNEYLNSRGFSHYEISNYSKTGYESIHNMQYWKMNEYIGCGPGAVSMIYQNGIKRISNPHDIDLYIKGKEIDWGITEEVIKTEDFLFENYMMGLRTKEGIDREVFFTRFSCYPEELIKDTLDHLNSDAFYLTDKNLSLNEDSRLFMNSILLKIYDEISLKYIDFKVNWP